jgi:glycine cleavage system T protein
MPQITTENLFGAIYLPRDGQLDPYLTTTGMARIVRDLGIPVYTDTRATGIQLSPKGEVTAVETNRGTIRCEHVVNATGLWGPRVAAFAGLHLPTTPVDHQHIALKAVPGNEFTKDSPCFRDPDYLVYGRQEAGGLVIGGYEPNPKARWIEGVPWEHGGASMPPDYERFEQLLEGAIQRFPFLERAEIITLVCHPGAYTPDCQPIIGPLPGARGFWNLCGMSLNGYGGAGGMGKLLAEWIVAGEPSLDAYAFRATRFGNYYSNPDYAAERTRECVKYYYRLRFPHDEYEWARPHRVSPVYFRTLERGAVFGEKYGWERVNYYEPGKPGRLAGEDQRMWGWKRPPFFERLRQEHEATRERACLYDLSSFGKIDLRGPGALSLLQRLADSNIDKPVGSAIYTQFLNNQGGVESDLTITRLDDDHFRAITGSGFISNDLGWIRLHVEPGDPPVEIRDVTLDWACLALWGPHARDILQKITDSDVSNQAIPYMTAAWINFNGTRVLAQRVSYAGELGWELYVDPQHATRLWDRLNEAGKTHEIEVGGYKVLDPLRLEKGYRYYTADVTPMEDPFSAGLGFCVDLEKADFIGRQALVEIKQRGLEHKLCTLLLEGSEYLPVYGGEAVYLNGEVISRVRSGGYGYTVQRNILFAYLPLELAKPGTRLEVDVFEDILPAEVTRSVLVDPKGEKLRT